MTRNTKSLFSILAVLATTAAIAPSAMADGYSSPSSIVGDQQPSTSGYSSLSSIVGDGSSASPSRDYSSVASITGDGGQTPAAPSRTIASSPSAILGADGVGEATPSAAGSPASDGFNWGDAAIGGAVGLALAAMVGAALIVTRRRRPGMQPSV